MSDYGNCCNPKNVAFFSTATGVVALGLGLMFMVNDICSYIELGPRFVVGSAFSAASIPFFLVAAAVRIGGSIAHERAEDNYFDRVNAPQEERASLLA